MNININHIHNYIYNYVYSYMIYFMIQESISIKKFLIDEGWYKFRYTTLVTLRDV